MSAVEYSCHRLLKRKGYNCILVHVYILLSPVYILYPVYNMQLYAFTTGTKNEKRLRNGHPVAQDVARYSP